MAAEDLPSEFDIVILGTGLAESVVAAACSRVGQRVLHLDRRSYYASNWASFTFNSLLTWIEQQQEEPEPEEDQDWSSLLEEGEELIRLSTSASVSNLQVFCFTSEDDEEPEATNTTEEEAADKGDTEETPEAGDGGSTEEESTETQQEVEETDGEAAASPHPPEAPSQSEPTRKKISYAQLVREGRRFNIDLVSKLMYSRGSLVDLLIKSNVSRYAEFKNVTRILTYRNGNVEQVPCSRADVFANRQLSMVEKRKLMRFLTSCLEETDEQQAYIGRPYLEFLRDQQLGDNLQHFLLHSIAMVMEDTPTEVGLTSTRHFLQCLGRYGNTPFLFPVYGLGEIPQCFCRMCAVFGGVYCLRHSVRCLLVDKDTSRCRAVIDSRGQRISCSHVVLEDSYLPAHLKKTATPTRFLSRAVLVTDGSIHPSDSEHQVSVVTVPPVEAGSPSVKMVELCPSTMTCIPGTYLVHLTCQSVGTAYDDLLPVVTRMFRLPEQHERVVSQETGGSPADPRPAVLWCVYFNMADGAGVEVEGHQLPSNVSVCSGPDGDLGHEHSIRQAQFIFQKILPGEEFCPPAPNPEDIIYDGENVSSSTGDEKVEDGENVSSPTGDEKVEDRENVSSSTGDEKVEDGENVSSSTGDEKVEDGENVSSPTGDEVEDGENISTGDELQTEE